jgi:hypothetical protein
VVNWGEHATYLAARLYDPAVNLPQMKLPWVCRMLHMTADVAA